MNLQRSRPPALQQVPPAGNGPGAEQSASHATAAGALEQPFFRLDVGRALELHRTLALSFAIAGLVLAVAYAVRAWPVYSAQSQVYIQPTSAKIMDQGNNPQRWPYDSNSYDSFILQQVQLASNPDVLVNAMHKLPAGSWQQANESEPAAAERLGRSLKVERLGASYQVAITAQAKDAEMAAQIANAVANSIVEKASHEANAGDTQRLAILQGERDRVQTQLNADLAEQDALNKQLGMAAVGTEAPDLIDSAIGATRQELIKARTDHDEAEARFAAMGAGKGTSSAALDAEADELVAGDPGLTSMKTSLNQRRATLITQMANLTPSNPEYKLDAEELTKSNASLDAMMKDLRAKASARIQEKLRMDLERTAGVEAQLNGQLRQLAATAASATPKLQRANDLATDIVRLRTRYAAVDEELHDIMLQDSVPGAVHLSVAAVAPLHPALAGILRKSLPLALAGILLGLLAALLANQLDPRVYIGADIKHVLGFAPMIALPDYGEVPDAVFEEHILRLATAIEHARKQGSLRTCIFTGTGPATGVTTVVTRARDMLASMGRPTVLVDATGTAQAAPRRSGPFQDGEAVGGERGTRSLALLRRVTAESGTQDDLVLTDTAPLLISAETEYLARFIDCAIVVVASGVTTRAELRATADALQRLNVSAVGLVLNRVGLAKADAAFRKSVQGVEAHLRQQGRAHDRTAPRSRHSAQQTPAAPMEHEMPQPVRRPPAAVAHHQDPRLAIEHATDEQPQAEQAEAERMKAERVAAAQAAVERAIRECGMAEPPAAVQSAEQVVPARTPEDRSHIEPQWGAELATPEPLHVPEWNTAPVAQELFALAAAPDPNLPWWLSETPLTTAELAALGKGEDGAEQPASHPVPNQPARVPARLNSLRNVIFGPGARALQKRGTRGLSKPRPEEQTLAPFALPRFEAPRLETEPFQTGPFETGPVAAASFEPAAPDTRPAVPAFEPPYTPTPEPIPTATGTAETYAEAAYEEHEPLHVMAAPEILPPMAGPPAKPDGWGSEATGMSGRLDRGDTLDDIQVLPSRRGQYSRKG